MGITREGYVSRTQREILQLIEGDELREISPNLDVSTDSVLGQVNGVFSRQLALVEELAQVAYGAFDPDKAEDDALVALCKLTGTVKRAATHSEVDCSVELASGVTLTRDTAFAAITGKPDIRFTPKASFTAPSTGTFTVRFTAERPGSISVNPNTLTTIATPIVGWNSIRNPAAATPGRPEDTNETLRARREQELAAAGSCTVQAIRADLLQLEENGSRNVQSVSVLENDTDVIDANGILPHSFECLVYDSPQISNDRIAQVIFDSKPAGIRALGTLTGTARDEDGNAHTVRFSRPVAREVHLTFEVVRGPGYVGDAAFTEYVVAECRKRFDSVGTSVIAWVVRSLPLALQGVANVPHLFLGFSTNPTGESDLTVGPREIATFDASRVVIT